MSSSNVKCSDTVSEKSERVNSSMVPPDQVVKTVDSNRAGSSSIQPVGAGRPITNIQRRQQNSKKSTNEKAGRKFDKSDNIGNAKMSSNKQKSGSPSNLSRGSSQNSLTGKMNSMSISDSVQNEFNKESSSSGTGIANNQNRQQNSWRNQNNRQHQPQGVSQLNYQSNTMYMRGGQNQSPNGNFSNTPHSRDSGPPSHLMQMQAFPPLPYPGNRAGGPHRSAPNSPGPINPIAGQHFVQTGAPLTRSPSLSGQEHHQVGSVGVHTNFGNCPPPPHAAGPRLNYAGYESPPPTIGAQGKLQDTRSKERNHPNFHGEKSPNSTGTGTHSSDGQSQKKQGNKSWKKSYNKPPQARGKRQSYPDTNVAKSYNKPINVVSHFGRSDHPQYLDTQGGLAGQLNFMPPPHSVHPPMLSPVTVAPFQQYVDAQQYTFAYYQGANYVPHQQWVPMTEGQSNFVPYTSAEMVPITMGPGMIPQCTVPYSVPPNVVPYVTEPNIVPYTNDPNIVPYTAIPYTSGMPSHGFVPSVPPPGPASVNAQVLSFTVSSRVGPITAASEAPNHQFKLSQLERTWEGNPGQRKFEGSSENQSREIVPASENGPNLQKSRSEEGEDQQKEPQWLPEKLKKMLDVASLEKLQRMSSANGKRVPMNARNKESPNHIPAASPPDVQEEVIKFICDSWNKVYQEYQKGNPAVAYNVDSEQCAVPEGFVPFDLNAYWGKRKVQNRATPQNIPTQNM